MMEDPVSTDNLAAVTSASETLSVRREELQVVRESSKLFLRDAVLGPVVPWDPSTTPELHASMKDHSFQDDNSEFNCLCLSCFSSDAQHIQDLKVRPAKNLETAPARQGRKRVITTRAAQGRNALREIHNEHGFGISDLGSGMLVHGRTTSATNTVSSIPPSSKDSISSKSTSASGNTCSKRKRTAGGGSRGHDEDDDDFGKRSYKDGDLPDSACLKFACPFRKHDHHKYNVSDPKWRVCANPFSGVARMKEHLYRRHIVISCPRCWEEFEKEEQREHHLIAPQACMPKERQNRDGVTDTVKVKLQSRKKAFAGQTEPERWEEVYRLLFPDDPVPSPYWEPEPPPNQATLVHYEEYLARELPRQVRSALELSVRDRLGDELKESLVRIVEDCQNQLFSSYRSQITSDTISSILLPPNSGIQPSTPSVVTSQSDDMNQIMVPHPIGDTDQGLTSRTNTRSFGENQSFFENGNACEDWGTTNQAWQTELDANCLEPASYEECFRAHHLFNSS